MWAAQGLIAGGVDLFLIETVFDTLNAKAAIAAIHSINDSLDEPYPLIISGTITDASAVAHYLAKPARLFFTPWRTQN